MKSRDRKSQREEKSRREKIREEREVRRKKIQVCEKVGKSRNTAFLQWFVAPEGRKVGSLKRRVRSQLARWEMKNCTPLRREAHFQVKMYRTLQFQSTCRSWAVEKVHAVVAACTYRSQNVQNTPASDHFWKLRCRKSGTKHTRSGPLLEVAMSKKCTPLWQRAHFEVKMYKAHQLRITFGSCDVEKVHAVVARSTCQSQNVQNTPGPDHFLTFRSRFTWQAQGIVHLARNEEKGIKRDGFLCSIYKNDGRRGTFEEDLQRCIFRGRRTTRDMFIRDVRRSGRWFPEKGCILEHQIFRFAEMILRDRCSTSYDLASLFRGRQKRIGTRQSALHSTFHFWRRSRRILSSLMLSTSENEEVSQNCFVFLTLSSGNIEEVSQNCFVFDVVIFEKWRSLAE